MFSDATLDNFAEADPATLRRDHAGASPTGTTSRSTTGARCCPRRGHGFSGLARQALLEHPAAAAREPRRDAARSTRGRPTRPRARDADLVVAADGVNCACARSFAAQLRAAASTGARTASSGSAPPSVRRLHLLSSRTTRHGLWRVHAYRYDGAPSTFIVECDRGDVAARRARRRRRGRDRRLSARSSSPRELARPPAAQEPLALAQLPDGPATRAGITTTWCCSATRRTPRTSRSARAPSWRWRTAIALARGARRASGDRRATALAAYEAERRPVGGERCSARRRPASSGSRTTERYHGRLEPPQFAFSLLTRSLRITHENLKVRDPAFVADGGPLVRRRRRQAERRPRAGRRRRRRRCSRRSGCASCVLRQPRRGLADVPVLGRGRHARRLAPGAPRQPRAWAAPGSS